MLGTMAAGKNAAAATKDAGKATGEATKDTAKSAAKATEHAGASGRARQRLQRLDQRLARRNINPGLAIAGAVRPGRGQVRGQHPPNGDPAVVLGAARLNAARRPISRASLVPRLKKTQAH